MHITSAVRPNSIRWWINIELYRLQQHLSRWQRAWAYATDRMTKDQASQMAYDCQAPAGSFSLISLDVDGVLEDASNTYMDHPDLERLCAEAVQRVASKFDDYTEVRSSCSDWALDLVVQYAKQEGVELTLIEDGTED